LEKPTSSGLGEKREGPRWKQEGGLRGKNLRRLAVRAYLKKEEYHGP